MQKYEDLIMGLISGIVLIFLNSNLVHRTLKDIFTFSSTIEIESFI